MKQFITYIFILCSLFASSQTKKYIRKASKAINKSNLELARNYYLKAYNLDNSNYKSNMGLGIVLSEFMDKHEEAIPYLETAYNKSPKDTMADLVYALAKCYHHVGKYDQALSMYHKLDASVALEDDDKLYQLELAKRKEDCLYGLNNTSAKNEKQYYIINAGTNINTKNPEYVPVLTPNNELIFTSRRQDTPKEKTNKADGKYYESMYISKLENGKPQSVRRYTLPDLYLKSKFRKHHESIISMSPDGKTLFVYRDSKVYEINIDAVSKEQPKKLSKTINFDYYQSHASLSKDGKILLFTSEAADAVGGIDIYKSVKNESGEWGKPENLGKTINTVYDEDAPFLLEDGKTLFFASKGHPGYGNYDIYKSQLVDGEWTVPENLGMPVNSPAHDIFMTQKSDAASGYFSSARVGGHGDMDIYKINFLENIKKECTDSTNTFSTIMTNLIDEANGLVRFNVTAPAHFKAIKYEWSLNNNTLNKDTNDITIGIPKESVNNVIRAKTILYCDTCLEPIALCNSVTYNFPKPEVLVDNTIKNKYDPELPLDYVTKDKISSLGFNLSPLHFNLNKSNIRNTEEDILNHNLKILKKHPDLAILIYGFTDARGTEKYNLTLSKRRVQQVQQYLVSKGLSEKQIKLSSGKGEQFLLNDCSDEKACDEASHEQNRRVEFLIINNTK